jgi:phenylacetic acid degradation protein
MNSVVMDNAVIGECAFVAALSFVRQGFEVPARTLVAGVPGKIVRELSDDEIAWKTAGTEEYQALARNCRDGGLVACAPRNAPEPGRPQLDPSDLKPLKETRQTSEG